ncbi:hypothetical protein AGOR_G00128580 [Albula goreensis]|uniref:NWD1/2-like winged helix-turn-helix domain-containing protein n=1 Tax=Albula goreensis TaxID=1534307 RepID=A0A8T3DCB7_9TELE|nr:hypothetical protein AGOR_G00128580 [Albula goreensis]
MLTDLLVSDGRRITSGQQVYVNQALKDCSLPLYVELLHRQVCTWSSRMDITEESVIKGVHDNIRRFLAQLEQDHGKELVCKAMCYLAIAKSGITEAELTDILSCENDVLSQYLPAGGVLPYKLRVPEAAVERLLYDLRGFLMKRNISGFQVLFWPSRHFPLVIHKVFLHTTEMVREAHSALADYFNGQWAYGRTKSMLSQNNVRETEHPCSSLPVTYTDRQLPGQPWVFNSLSEDMDINVRKILELPFHLKNSGRLEELLSGVMLSPGFHQGMLKAGHLEGLVSHLKETTKLMACKELGFLSTLIRDAACLLQNSPKDLIAVMQAQLFPFLEVLPKLNSYAKHIYQEGVRTQGVNVLHSPVSAVPSTSWELPDVVSSPVMEVLETQCDAVVTILHDSTIWVWNEKVFGGYKPFHSSDFNISNMKSAGHFLLLSTNSNRLILYNLKTPSYICELDVHTIVSSAKDPDLALTIDGFMFTENRIILWYRATNFIHIFDINTGERIEQLLCPNIVTCVSFSHDHQFILCGQDKSTVSIFSVHSNSHLATCSSSMATSIMNVPICEDEHMMACVDRFGNVIVWDIKTLTNPKLREEIYNMNDQDEVLNTEHLMGSSTFLICKRHQIVLWDTHNWTVEDQFKAPRDKVFIQAVLAKDGLLIIACLEDCPFLLVWKRTSGQCVLSLDIGHSSEVLRLLKMGSALLAVTLDGAITTWDVDLIWSASVISKTGLKVEKLVVDSTGQQFYTADGTEMIWKWGVLSRTAKGCFLHDGPVETFAVSKDCKHLVTASPRDIYVWQTVTGENLHRIHGSHVSSLLITPNGNFAVSLCKRGLSSVWNLESGHVVCNVHLYLSNAVISPESTFILGLHKAGATITILDTLKSKLCSLQAEGQVLMVCLDVTGCYVVFICNADNPNGCNCDLHSGPVLSAVRISDKKNVGKFFLCKLPCSLSLSGDLSAFVGFSDGSVGVYAISDAAESSVMVGKCLHLMGQQTPCPCEEPQRWLPLTNPSIIRMASTNDIV